MNQPVAGKPRWQRTLGDYPLILTPSPTGAMVAVGLVEGGIALLSPEDGSWMRRLRGHAQGLAGLGWAANDVMVSAGQDGAVRWWTAPGGDPLGEHPGLGRHADGLAVSPATGAALVAWGTEPMLFDRSRRGRALEAQPRMMSGMAASPDGALLAGGCLGQVAFWHAAAAGPTPAFVAPVDSMVHRIAFSPDGQWVAAACQDASIRLLRAHARRDGDIAMGPLRRRARAMAWAYRAQWLAVANEELVVTINTMGMALAKAGTADDPEAFGDASAHAIREHRAGNDLVTALAFHPTGALLAVGTACGEVILQSPEQPSHSRPGLTRWGSDAIVHLVWLDEQTLLVANASGAIAALPVKAP